MLILTDSACPVRFAGADLFVVRRLPWPPAYPDTASDTPFSDSKTASTPQKQPPARTAVCGPEAAGLIPCGIWKTGCRQRHHQPESEQREQLFSRITTTTPQQRVNSRMPKK